jgi:hypothetical protein
MTPGQVDLLLPFHTIYEIIDPLYGIFDCLIHILLSALVYNFPPLAFDHVPQALDWVQGAAVRRQIFDSEVAVPLFADDACLVHTEVVQHNEAPPAPALLPKTLKEGEEGVLVIGPFEDIGIDDASLLTERANHTYGGASVVGDFKGHAGSLPHLRGLYHRLKEASST